MINIVHRKDERGLTRMKPNPAMSRLHSHPPSRPSLLLCAVCKHALFEDASVPCIVTDQVRLFMIDQEGIEAIQKRRTPT